MGSFKGGLLFTDQHKEITKDKPIVKLEPPARIVVPVKQHAGNPARPIVRKGDHVLKGQKIAECDGHMSLPLHSSISGVINDIVPWKHPLTAENVLSIIIDSDGLDKAAVPAKSYPDYFRYSHDELRGAIREAGVAGLGGEVMPTHLKLNPPRDIDILIINGCESELYITSNDRIMRENLDELIDGIKISMYVLNAFVTIMAVEDNKSEVIEKINKRIFNEPNIRVCVLKTKYPQGAEKQLIKAVTKKTVPAGRSAYDEGVVVMNVATCLAVSRAVKSGLPLVENVVTVSGSHLQEPGNYLVRLGTLVNDLLVKCGFYPGEGKHRVILGGPMRGVLQDNLEVPLIKGINGITVLGEDKDGIDFRPCIKCGRCVNACPMRMMPNMISVGVENKRLDKTARFHPEDCIGCGCCSYVCVSKRPIVEQIKIAKSYLADLKQFK